MKRLAIGLLALLVAAQAGATRYVRKNTATIISVGPFFDKTDGVTLETALTITAEKISLDCDTDDGSAPTIILDNVTGATSGTANDLNYITGQDNGMMQIELAAADINRLGRCILTITDALQHVPVFHELEVVNSAVYDAFYATSGGAIPNAVAGASGGVLISGSNSGTTTLAALTVTGTATISDGLLISRSTANTAAMTLTGNGSGNGLTVTGGAASGATAAGHGLVLLGGASSTTAGGTAGDGLRGTGGAASTANNVGGHGANVTGGAGSEEQLAGHGLLTTGGAAGATNAGGLGGDGHKGVGGVATAANAGGNGLNLVGADAVSTGGSGLGLKAVGGAATTSAGGTSSPAISVTGGAGAASTNGAAAGVVFTAGGTTTVDGDDGLRVVGTAAGAGLAGSGGATGQGAKLVGGGTSGEGLLLNTTSGDGIKSAPTAGHGLNLAANGTSKHGLFTTGGTAGTSDGASFVAGSGGTDLRAPAITGTLATVTTYTGNTVQTGDSFARIGAAGAGLTAIDLPNQTMDITGTLSTVTTYTGNTPQTGDAFARLGAPAGASTAADIAALQADSDLHDTNAELCDAVFGCDATGEQVQGTFGQVLGDSAADADTLWALVNGYGATGSGLTAIDLPNQTMDIAGTLTTVTTAGTCTALGAGAVSPTAVATGAFDADALAADAVEEITGWVCGVCDSGSTTTCVDAARTEADTDYWANGSVFLVTSGTSSGQERRISAFTPGSDTLTLSTALTQAITTNSYCILRVAYAEAPGAGATDWSAGERSEIRFRLSMSGSQTDPATTTGGVEIATTGIEAGDFTAGAIDAAAVAAAAITSSEAPNLDASVSSRASQTSVDTVDNFVDDLESRLGTPSDLGGGATVAFNLSDIEGLADNLPTDPCDDSDIDAQLVAIDDYVDTEVAAIKTRTDSQSLEIVRANTAQAGAATTITLDASASAVNRFYNYDYVRTTGGTGVGQVRLVTAYVGSTKVATVFPSWVVTPDATTTFEIVGWFGQ